MNVIIATTIIDAAISHDSLYTRVSPPTQRVAHNLRFLSLVTVPGDKLYRTIAFVDAMVIS
jgi:hypothetical protein